MKIAISLRKRLLHAVILVTLSSQMGVQAATRPNIILLLADDISAREIPAYGSTVWSKPEGGDTSDLQFRAQTPVLDKLADQGCLIENAWAAVVCSPSRAMLMTGRYAHLHKWWENKDKGVYQDARGKYVTWPLYESSPNLIEMIAKNGGYTTFWAGKTQMAGDITRFNFDEAAFTPGGNETDPNPNTDFRLSGKQAALINEDTGEPINNKSYAQQSWYWQPSVQLLNNPAVGKGLKWWPSTPEEKKSYSVNTYGPDVELKFIFDFMQRKAKAEQPFFVYHCSHLGHDAFNWLDPDSTIKWPPAPIVKWNGKGYTRTGPNITGDHGKYDTHGSVTSPGIHNHINYLDYQVWQYLNKMKELGIDENTIFIFCADNGTWGYGKNNTNRQRGTHVPMIIYAPGMTKHGRQNVLADLSDLLPTIAEITGGKIPEGYEINGQSLMPFLMTDKPKHREWVYAYWGADQMIRDDQVLHDGKGNWWDVSKMPADFNSFPPINDWNAATPAQKASREKLEAIMKPFDKHDTEHDAPGVPPQPKNGRKNAGGGDE